MRDVWRSGAIALRPHTGDEVPDLFAAVVFSLVPADLGIT